MSAAYVTMMEKMNSRQSTPIAVEPATFTENGTYTAPSGTAFSPVTVNVKNGSKSVSVEPITITSNGKVTAPDGKAYSPITVDVPQPELSDVVFRANGTYVAPDGIVYNKAVVNVPTEGVPVVEEIPNPSSMTDGTVIEVTPASRTNTVWYAFKTDDSSTTDIIYTDTLDSITLDAVYVWNVNRMVQIELIRKVSAFEGISDKIRCTCDSVSKDYLRNDQYDVLVTDDFSAYTEEYSSPYVYIFKANVDNGLPLINNVFQINRDNIICGTIFADEINQDSQGLLVTFKGEDTPVRYWDNSITGIVSTADKRSHSGYITKEDGVVKALDQVPYEFVLYSNGDGTVSVDSQYYSAYSGLIFHNIVAIVDGGEVPIEWASRLLGRYSEGLCAFEIGNPSDVDVYITLNSFKVTDKTEIGYGIVQCNDMGYTVPVFVPIPYRID